jgi:hypothetical protein
VLISKDLIGHVKELAADKVSIACLVLTSRIIKGGNSTCQPHPAAQMLATVVRLPEIFSLPAW